MMDNLKPLQDAMARMAAFAVSKESLPEEADDIHLIENAVSELLHVFRDLVTESGGNAIPNSRLTAVRADAVSTLRRWGEL